MLRADNTYYYRPLLQSIPDLDGAVAGSGTALVFHHSPASCRALDSEPNDPNCEHCRKIYGRLEYSPLDRSILRWELGTLH